MPVVTWVSGAVDDQGATANEDRLQEDVPETISTLAEAGVKVLHRVDALPPFSLLPT